MKTPIALPCWFVLTAAMLATACQRESAAAVTAPLNARSTAATGSPAVATEDQPLLAFQKDLLQLAFRAASAFPMEPHRKNRSRLQERVVVTCFELDQPHLAIAFARDIADWRRGAAYADYAHCVAKRGDAKAAHDYIQLAKQVAEEQRDLESAQDWQGDTIQLKIARAYAVLGETKSAQEASAKIDATTSNAVDKNWAQTAADRVALLTAEQVRAELTGIDTDFARMSLGQQQVALQTLVRIHGRFFGEVELRHGIEERVTTTFAKIPPGVRLDAEYQLVQTCLAQHDTASAGRLLSAARQLVAGHTWRTEDQVPQLARLAALRHQAGEPEQARADAEAAVALYHQDRDQIVDIYRAGTVRAIAVAFQQMGDSATAHDLCALAIEEGLENPNSRPRAEDLIETCLAMASQGIAPSAAFQARLQQVCQGLRDPW